MIINFICIKCGNMTPGLFGLPERKPPRNKPIQISNDCAHCGRSMTAKFPGWIRFTKFLRGKKQVKA